MLDVLLSPRKVAMMGWMAALAMPAAALLVYWLLGRRSEDARRLSRRRWVLWLVALGAFGPAMIVLWSVFNAVEEFFGLDSVFSLGVNLLVFSAVGFSVGVLLRTIGCKRGASSDGGGAPRGSSQ